MKIAAINKNNTVFQKLNTFKKPTLMYFTALISSHITSPPVSLNTINPEKHRIKNRTKKWQLKMATCTITYNSGPIPVSS